MNIHDKHKDAVNALTGATIDSIDTSDGGFVIITTSGLRFEVASTLFHNLIVAQVEK